MTEASSRVELTAAQSSWLVYLEHSPKTGREAARKHPVLCALETRGLARFGGTRALPRIEAWHITLDGIDWLDARRADDQRTAR